MPTFFMASFCEWSCVLFLLGGVVSPLQAAVAAKWWSNGCNTSCK